MVQVIWKRSASRTRSLHFVLPGKIPHSPPEGPGAAFERTHNCLSDPSAVEVALLCQHQFVVYIACVH